VVFWGLESLCLVGFLWILREITAHGSEQLKALRLIVGIVQVLGMIFGWLPLVGSICAAAALVIGGVFLLAFWKEMKSAE